MTLYAALVAGLLIVGIWAADRAGAAFGHEDDGRIVIDEVVGQLLALWPLLILCDLGSMNFELLVGVVTGFVLFRLFDIWKPGAVRWAERRFRGGVGVMADDVVAGIQGALVLVVVQVFCVPFVFEIASGIASGSLAGPVSGGGAL